MNIKQLEYFVAIAESENITAAAKKLGIAQPPLSVQLKNLEDEAGCMLLDRSGRNLRLTAAGTLLYNRAQKILEMSSATLKDVRAIGAGEQTAIRLGLISSCGKLFLDEKIGQFAQAHPGLVFQVSEGNTYQLLDNIREGQIDLAVVRTPFSREGFQGRYLGTEYMAAVSCGTDEGDTVTIDNLAQHPLIIYRRMERLIRDAFNSHDLEPRIVCVNDDARTALMWAGTGIGTAIVPRSIVDAFEGKQFCVKRILEDSLCTRTALIWRRASVLTGVQREFTEMFEDREKL